MGEREKPDRALARWIDREHASLDTRIGVVEAELARLNTSPSRNPRSLIRLLATFDKHMRRHFAFEEEGGPFDEIGRDRAQAPGVAEVSLRHVQLESDMANLLVELTTSPPPPKARIVHRIRGFLAELRDHETREQALFAVIAPRPIHEVRKR